jgi:hypothetical protein
MKLLEDESDPSAWMSIKSTLDPHELESRLRCLGFSAVAHFSKAEAMARYLRGRTDGLTVPGYSQLIKATM